jgi:hypothetical protein
VQTQQISDSGFEASRSRKPHRQLSLGNPSTEQASWLSSHPHQFWQIDGGARRIKPARGIIHDIPKFAAPPGAPLIDLGTKATPITTKALEIGEGLDVPEFLRRIVLVGEAVPLS